MIPLTKNGARLGLALLGAAALLAPAARAAQPAYGNYPETPGDALSRNLKLIAESPHNVGAMLGAGKAALELGDAQAALTFFARAEQDAPRDGWVKKWMGSALVQLEQPAAALKFFRDAASLGVPDASLAGDRGLAWDISGDPRRAQRDYRVALSAGSDPEITRRLALSLAISGEREPALRLLENQLMERDRAAIRTRALVLALTGDWQGAGRAVETAMPGPQAAALEPFLSRLPSLSLADRALAVHLGHFPGTGRNAAPATTYAQNGYGGGLPAGYTPTPSYSPPAASRQDRYASLDAISPDESRPAFGTPQTRESVSTEARRIPGGQAQAAAPRPAPSRRPDAQDYAPSRSQWSWSHGELAPAVRIATRTASAQGVRPPQPAAHRPEPPTVRIDRPPEPRPGPVEIADAEPVTAPPVTLPATRAPAPPPEQVEPAAARPASVPAPRSRLAEVAAALDRIDEVQRERNVRSAPVPAATTRSSALHSRAAAPAPKPKKAPPADPARHWVQIAGGADRGKLPREFARLKDKAPKLFAGRALWTATANATNRLLVGPFDSSDEAQDFVNRLAKADLGGFAWNSEAGQKIEKLAAR
jgi:Flp pilus assembly protein TadD